MNRNPVTYNPDIGEWQITIPDQPVAYASTQGKAWEMYREAMRVRREHRQRGNNDER